MELEKAAEIISKIMWSARDDWDLTAEEMEAYEMVIKTAMCKGQYHGQIDPETRLVYCGCGGKAAYIYYGMASLSSRGACVECTQCGARSALATSHYDYPAELVKMGARDNWNISHGWRETYEN